MRMNYSINTQWAQLTE